MNAKGLNPSYVRRAFAKAGFKLSNGGHGNRCFQYISSAVRVRYVVDAYQNGDNSLEVCFGYQRWTEFKRSADAIRFIRARLSMQVVGGSDYALRTEPRGQFEVIMGGAA